MFCSNRLNQNVTVFLIDYSTWKLFNKARGDAWNALGVEGQMPYVEQAARVNGGSENLTEEDKQIKFQLLKDQLIYVVSIN